MAPVFSIEIMEIELTDDRNHLIRPHSFTIHNAANQKIDFFLAAEGKDWTRYQLLKDLVKEYSDGKSNSYTIKIPTSGRGSVQYSIKASKRYQFTGTTETVAGI